MRINRVGKTGEPDGFTLLEVLVAVAIFAIILGVVLSVFDKTSSTLQRSSEKIEAFQDSRNAFELITRNLSQATLNAYLDYDDPANPAGYFRQSDLRFVCGPAGVSPLPGTPGTGQSAFFQASMNYTRVPATFGGLEGALNACGYFVLFGSDSAEKPGFVTSPERHRYRLMQLITATEQNSIFAGGDTWFSDHVSEARSIADNIIALIVRPQDPAATPPDLSTNYTYDTALSFPAGAQPVTSNQLPPVVAVTVIAIDERSAKRLEDGANPPAVIQNALAGKFLVPADYENDLRKVEEALTQATPSIACRIFQMAVPIRESRWTK